MAGGIQPYVDFSRPSTQRGTWPQPKKHHTTEATEVTEKRLCVSVSAVSVISVVDLFFAARKEVCG
jgi:hypothetical protein